jgi:hypothetical protein
MRLLALVAAGLGAVTALVPAPSPRAVEQRGSEPSDAEVALAKLQKRACNDQCAAALFSFAGTPQEGQRRGQCRNFMTQTVFVRAYM